MPNHIILQLVSGWTDNQGTSLLLGFFNRLDYLMTTYIECLLNFGSWIVLKKLRRLCLSLPQPCNEPNWKTRTSKQSLLLKVLTNSWNWVLWETKLHEITCCINLSSSWAETYKVFGQLASNKVENVLSNSQVVTIPEIINSTLHHIEKKVTI